MEYPCHKLPKTQWCDYKGKGGFMGHTCIKQSPSEQNFVGGHRNEITDKEIMKSLRLVKEKIQMRLLQKHRGSYIGNHETYGILAEEYDELLKALRANDNEEFYAELIDIAVGAILGMASMYANQALQKEAKELVWSKRAKTLKMKVHKLLNDQWTICGMYNNRRRVTTTREDTTCERCIRIYDNNVAKQKEAKE